MSPLSRACIRLREALSRLEAKPIRKFTLIALLLTVVIEALSRHELFGGIAFLFTEPLMFTYNLLIILFTLSLALFFPKRNFVLFLVSLLWLVLGITNCILLFFATIPLGFTDIFLLGSVLGILDVYLSTFDLVLICVLLALSTVCVVLMWRRSEKKPVKLWRSSVCLGKLGLGLIVLSLCTSNAAAFSDSFANLADAYEDFGFVYCFSTSVVDRGVSKPDDYSEERIEAIRAGLRKDPNAAVMPDIIFVQLESFFDPSRYKGVTLSENPIPVFTELRKTCSNGDLTVPVLGAGTANTEFETLTGMSLDYFGAGEYPYETVLKSSTCESLAYALREAGYSSTAIHNNTRTFYGRDLVFANLGFDRFVSVEDMENVSYNPTGWANDDVLTEEILSALDESDGSDFIYTISVQAHGKYTEAEEKYCAFGAEGVENEDPDAGDPTVSWEYFATQLAGTDAFIGELVDALEERGEPAVVVLFGDHLPNLDINKSKLDNYNLFKTEYLIWSNMRLEKIDRDLSAYQLGAYVEGRLGLSLGTLEALHQKYSYDANSAEYLSAIELLEYDMLYGNRYAYGEQGPYAPTQLSR